MKNSNTTRRKNAWKKLFTCLVLIISMLGEKQVMKDPLVVSAAQSNQQVDTVITDVRTYMLSHDTNPDYSSIWNVIDMMRCGSLPPDDYQDKFYKNTIQYLKANNWEITKNKYTDYSKLILGMTAIGKNAQNIEGYNLLGYLSDFSKVKKQGFNGPIWALIALKSHPSYQIPNNPDATEQTTEEGLIQYLLSKETSNGGWTLAGTAPDTDITGMTIQALSPYYGQRQDVTDAIDRAVGWLSSAQLPSGGYGTMGIETSESVAQVIVALCSIGYDFTEDERFIKNGKNPLDGLFQYYLSEGGFMHVAAGAGNNGGGVAGTLDGLATEQGMYATIAYKRMLNGDSALYDMSDITLSSNGIGKLPPSETKQEPSTSASTTEKKEQTTQAEQKIKVSKISLDYSQIGLIKGQKKSLIATVLPASATNKKVTWKSSDKKIATVTQSGVVKGIKKGTATITVTAQDGSGAKATCTVKVTQASGKTVNPAAGTTRKQTPTGPVRTGNATQTGGTSKGGGNVNTTGNKNQGQDNSEEASTESGWSFDGADYVPENYESDDSAEDIPNNNDTAIAVEDNGQKKVIDWDGKNLTISIPLGPLAYILLGMAILGGIEGIIFLVRKKKKLGHE